MKIVLRCDVTLSVKKGSIVYRQYKCVFSVHKVKCIEPWTYDSMDIVITHLDGMRARKREQEGSERVINI